MCTIAFLIDVVDGAPLVVGANRDELYARAARPPERLGPHIAGGVDELSGGTWLAVRADGRFAAVTNQRALAAVPHGLRSRGHAVRELAAADDADAYVAAIDPSQYASMNLAWGDSRGARIAYIRRESPDIEIIRLERGIHILANDRVGAAGFPRAERLAAALAPVRTLDDAIAVLKTALADHTTVASGRTPASSAAEGQRGLIDPPHSHLPDELARALTATCIHSPTYGTRCSTILAANAGRLITYLHADGPPCTTPYLDRMELVA